MTPAIANAQGFSLLFGKLDSGRLDIPLFVASNNGNKFRLLIGKFRSLMNLESMLINCDIGLSRS